MLESFDSELLGKMRNGLPLKRFCRPEEIAEACLFLSSSGPEYITGEVLKIDGGGYFLKSLNDK
jgi:NAD(P)-dependent dehydrogenase (short-subunit alcohol dehydrogenase family)